MSIENEALKRPVLRFLLLYLDKLESAIYIIRQNSYGSELYNTMKKSRFQ